MPRPYQTTFDDFVNDILLGCAMCVAIDEPIVPKVYLFQFGPTGNVRNYKALDARKFMNDDNKPMLAAIMNGLMQEEQSPVDALLFVSEAWKGRPGTVRPVDDPKRSEILTLTLRYKQPAGGTTLIYDIDRTRKLLVADEHVSGLAVHGRFSPRGY
jgi:hypothetical protein